jgi:hypothetical protein
MVFGTRRLVSNPNRSRSVILKAVAQIDLDAIGSRKSGWDLSEDSRPPDIFIAEDRPQGAEPLSLSFEAFIAFEESAEPALKVWRRTHQVDGGLVPVDIGYRHGPAIERNPCVDETLKADGILFPARRLGVPRPS